MMRSRDLEASLTSNLIDLALPALAFEQFFEDFVYISLLKTGRGMPSLREGRGTD